LQIAINLHFIFGMCRLGSAPPGMWQKNPGNTPVVGDWALADRIVTKVILVLAPVAH